MTGSSDMADAMMWGLQGMLRFRNKSIEWLMESLRAIREKRYPTPSHKSGILSELKRRVPNGCLTIWNERSGLCPK